MTTQTPSTPPDAPNAESMAADALSYGLLLEAMEELTKLDPEWAVAYLARSITGSKNGGKRMNEVNLERLKELAEKAHIIDYWYQETALKNMGHVSYDAAFVAAANPAAVLSLISEVERLRAALEWIADKKDDTSGAHSHRSILMAKKALGK